MKVIEMSLDKDEVTKLFFIVVGIRPLDLMATMAFIQSNWNTVRDDVMHMFAKFFSSGKFVASFSSTFLGVLVLESKS